MKIEKSRIVMDILILLITLNKGCIKFTIITFNNNSNQVYDYTIIDSQINSA